LPRTASLPPLAWALSGPDDAPTVVLVGGVGSAQAAWIAQVKGLSDRWRVLTYDHRGTGGSGLEGAGPRPATMGDYVEDLCRLLDELGIARISAVGLSFGGRVLLSLALERPERLDRLVLGGTSAGGDGVARAENAGLRSLGDPPLADPAAEADRWERQILPLLFGERWRRRHPERLANLARWRARHPASAEGLARQWEALLAFDVRARLGEIRAPTLVIHGSDDRVSPVDNALALVRGIPGARLELLDGVGHSPNVEAPEEMNAILRAFLGGEPS